MWEALRWLTGDARFLRAVAKGLRWGFPNARNNKTRGGRVLLGRGNLNLNNNILIFNDIYGLIFVVEYHLEYRFPKRYFAWDSNLRPSRMLGLSAGRSLN